MSDPGLQDNTEHGSTRKMDGYTEMRSHWFERGDIGQRSMELTADFIRNRGFDVRHGYAEDGVPVLMIMKKGVTRIPNR